MTIFLNVPGTPGQDQLPSIDLPAVPSPGSILHWESVKYRVLVVYYNAKTMPIVLDLMKVNEAP